MDFEWNPRKAEINLRKHGVSFPEAVTVPNPDHSEDEERFITIGWSNRRRLLMVSHIDRGDRNRIISARELTRAERKAYEEEI